MLDSGAEGPGFKSQPLSGTSLRQTVHTHLASVQAAKLVAALLRVARVTAGLVESNGSLLPGLWLTSSAGWLPRTRISAGTLLSVTEYGLPFSDSGRTCHKTLPLCIRCCYLAEHILSVCPIQLPHTAAAGLLLWAQEILIDCCSSCEMRAVPRC